MPILPGNFGVTMLGNDGISRLEKQNIFFTRQRKFFIIGQGEKLSTSLNQLLA